MSDDKIISLGKERKARTNNSKDWTPTDALEAALQWIKDNPDEKIDRACLMLGLDHGETRSTQWFTAGVNSEERVGWMVIHLIRTIAEG